MSKNKASNSILFLTTLSVYLGLVLVGASPSVLAQQAALSQKFEIQKEIETEDDLDKNPDEESLEQYLLVRLDDALNAFAGDLRELERNGKYNRKAYFSTGYSCEYCTDGSSTGTSGIALVSKYEEFFDLQIKLRKKLNITISGRDADYLPNYVGASVADGNEFCKRFSIGFSLDKSEFEVDIRLTQNPQTESITAENLNSLFSIKALNAQNPVTKQVYTNTKAKAENQYVIVTTRLARGSLDALVKSEKQAY